jgi:hypothetical protein
MLDVHSAGQFVSVTLAAKPEDIPAERPTTFDLVIDLTTAIVLGTTNVCRPMASALPLTRDVGAVPRQLSGNITLLLGWAQGWTSGLARTKLGA